MLFREHLQYLHQHIEACPTLRETICLAKVTRCNVSDWEKVWLRQRGFYNSIDSMNGFLVSMILCHLHATRQVTNGISSFQMFKVLMQFIGDLQQLSHCQQKETF